MYATREVGRSTIYLVVGRIVSLLASLGTVKVLTGYLGGEGFGKYSVVVDYLGLFAILIDLGLHLLGAQAVTESETDEERDRKLNSIISLRLLVGVAVFFSASLLILLFPYEIEVKQGVAIASISALSYSLIQLGTGIFQGFMRAELGAISEATARLFVFLFVYLCAQWELGFLYALSALTAGNGLGALLTVMFFRRLFELRVIFDRELYEDVLKHGVPLGLVMVTSYMYVKQDTIILSLYPYMPEGITNNEAVGIYKVPYRLIETIQGLPVLFLTALFPHLTEYADVDHKKFSKIAQRAFDLLVIVSVPMVVGAVILSDEIISLITSGEFGWSRAALTFNILIFSSAISFFNNYANHIVTAFKDQMSLVLPNVCYLAINIFLNLLTIPFYAHNGAAISTVITEVVVLFGNFWVVYKSTKWIPSFRALVPSLSISILMGLAVYYVNYMGAHVVFSIPIGAFVYLLVSEVLGAFPEGISLKIVFNKVIMPKNR